MPDTKREEATRQPVAEAKQATHQAAETKPESAPTATPAHSIEGTKSFAFTGQHFPGRIIRTVSTADPSNKDRVITARKQYDLITNLVIERVSGMGNADKTGEPYITLSGQYGPFATARITASSQNKDTVVELLKGNVDKTEGAGLPLLKKIVVDVVCTPMRAGTFGYKVEELYLHNADGTMKTIIAAPAQAAQESVETAFF